MNMNSVNFHEVCFTELSVATNPSVWANIDTLVHAKFTSNSNTVTRTTDTNIANTESFATAIIAQLQGKNLSTATMTDEALTAWFIPLFATLFAEHSVTLVHASSIGKDEPEYLPIDTISNLPAMIGFAHGFFSSALHEISHWSIAGKHRRTIPDFGYWYEPDGRNEGQQQQFEQVEIKPQAIECLLTLACDLNFRVSQDNLFSDFDTSNSTFEYDVYQQASAYLTQPETLPRDARTLLMALYVLCR